MTTGIETEISQCVEYIGASKKFTGNTYYEKTAHRFLLISIKINHLLTPLLHEFSKYSHALSIAFVSFKIQIYLLYMFFLTEAM